MQISPAGLSKLETFESGSPKKAQLQPYLCSAGYVTIGWGHVILSDGKMMHGTAGLKAAQSVYPGGITIEKAQSLLAIDIGGFETCVTEHLTGATTQNQFDAMVCLAFNIGKEGFGTSSVIRLHNQGKTISVLTLAEASEQVGSNAVPPTSAPDAFLLWNKETVGGKKVVSDGLTKRRGAERALYLTGTAATSAAPDTPIASNTVGWFQRVFG